MKWDKKKYSAHFKKSNLQSKKIMKLNNILNFQMSNYIKFGYYFSQKSIFMRAT